MFAQVGFAQSGFAQGGVSTFCFDDAFFDPAFFDTCTPTPSGGGGRQQWALPGRHLPRILVPLEIRNDPLDELWLLGLIDYPTVKVN